MLIDASAPPWEAEPAIATLIGLRVRAVRKDGGEFTHQLRAIRAHRVFFVDGTEWNIEDLVSAAPAPVASP